MRDFLDLFQMIAECERKSRNTSTYFQTKSKVTELPDEIDLYNFFEKYKGVAKGIIEDNSYSKLFGYHAYYMTKSFETRSLSEYLSIYEDTVTINYHIGNNRYYAIKFKKRGVFLVSEERYKELKARKGCTV